MTIFELMQLITSGGVVALLAGGIKLYGDFRVMKKQVEVLWKREMGNGSN